MDPTAVRVVFMGSPSFAEPSLRALRTSGYHVVLAVSQPDRPAGRGGRVMRPPVKALAESLGIDVFQPESLRDDAAVARISGVRPDVFVVAAYGRIIPRSVLALPSRGALNVHASLLPRWRGASPIAAAILAGDSETGVSIMEVAPRMDAGPVVALRAVPISPCDSTGSLEQRLAGIGAELLIETLPAWFERAVEAKPQDEGAATYCTLIAKQDGHLRASMTAVQAERAVRAYDPWPGAFVVYRGDRLAIWKASCQVAIGAAELPGRVSVIDGRPAVAFSDGWLVLEEVQRQGGRRLAAESFLNGERNALPPEVVLA